MNYFDILFAKYKFEQDHPPIIKRATGNPIVLTDAADAPLVECVADVVASQDLHGYDKPWVGGAGKNKLPLPAEQTINGLTLTYLPDGGIKLTGSPTDTTYFDCFAGTFDSTAYAGYIFKVSYTEASSAIRFRISQFNRVSLQELYDNTVVSDNGSGLYLSLRVTTSAVIPSSGFIIYPMLLSSSETDYNFAPYSNICPISGFSEVGIDVAEDDQSTPIEYTIDLNGTRYGGTVDVVRGKMTLTHGYVVFDGSSDENWLKSSSNQGPFYINVSNIIRSSIGLCNCAEFVILSDYAGVGKCCMSATSFNVWLTTEDWTVEQFKTYIASHNIEIVYKLATPVEVSLTPTAIRTLLGDNYISCDTGDLDITYLTRNYQNFVDIIENNLGTRKGGIKPLDVFRTLEVNKEPEEEEKKDEKVEEVKK